MSISFILRYIGLTLSESVHHHSLLFPVGGSTPRPNSLYQFESFINSLTLCTFIHSLIYLYI